MSDINYIFQQIRLIKNGNGLQYLIDEASKILGNPIFIHDLECRALAYTKNVVTDDQLWNDFVVNQGRTKEAMEFLKNIGVYDIAASAKKAVLLSGEHYKYNRIFSKISLKDKIVVAGMDIIACNKPFGNDDLEAFEMLCAKVCKEVNSLKYFQDYGQKSLEKYFKILIDGNIEDKNLLTVHVENIYEGLNNYLFLAVADITNSTKKTDLNYFKDLFKKIRPPIKCFTYSNYLICLFSTAETYMNKDILKQFKKISDKNNLRFEISTRFENLFETRKYFLEAVNALTKLL